jgi:hypothetical protein
LKTWLFNAFLFVKTLNRKFFDTLVKLWSFNALKSRVNLQIKYILDQSVTRVSKNFLLRVYKYFTFTVYIYIFLDEFLYIFNFHQF